MDWVADSAGLAAYGDPVNPNAVKALAEKGIKDFCYTSKRLNPQLIIESDRIVAMTESHESMLRSFGVDPQKLAVLGGGIPDPYGGDAEDYALCLAQIAKGIQQLLDGGALNDRTIE